MADLPSWARPGQRVVCVKVGGWIRAHDAESSPSPTFGEVLTINYRGWSPPEGWFLGFHEMPPDDMYLIDAFRPVIDDDTEAELFRTKKRPSSGAAHHLLPDGKKNAPRAPARERVE